MSRFCNHCYGLRDSSLDKCAVCGIAAGGRSPSLHFLPGSICLAYLSAKKGAIAPRPSQSSG
ncbi:MAG: hypothetical protein SNJ81_01215 [Cyanobacteriota bacterium]